MSLGNGLSPASHPNAGHSAQESVQVDRRTSSSDVGDDATVFEDARRGVLLATAVPGYDDPATHEICTAAFLQLQEEVDTALRLRGSLYDTALSIDPDGTGGDHEVKLAHLHKTYRDLSAHLRSIRNLAHYIDTKCDGILSAADMAKARNLRALGEGINNELPDELQAIMSGERVEDDGPGFRETLQRVIQLMAPYSLPRNADDGAGGFAYP